MKKATDIGIIGRNDAYLAQFLRDNRHDFSF